MCAQTFVFKMCSLVFCVPFSYGLGVVFADTDLRLQRYRHPLNTLDMSFPYVSLSIHHVENEH
jgi:hypothetical protein